MFQFTDPILIGAVIEAHRRGVKVRVMLNPSRFTGEHDNDEAFAMFRNAQVPVEETNPRYPHYPTRSRWWWTASRPSSCR